MLFQLLVHWLIHPASIYLASTICWVVVIEKEQYIQFNECIHPAESYIYVFIDKIRGNFEEISISQIMVFSFKLLKITLEITMEEMRKT